METIYRTIDGKEFTEEEKAISHEENVKNNLYMWDENGNRVELVNKAFLLYFANPEAAETFDLITEQQEGVPYNFVTKNKTGFFFWDEYGNEYRPITKDSIDAIAMAAEMIREREDDGEPKNYYDYEISAEFGENEQRRREINNPDGLMRTVSQVIAFSDCSDERVTRIVYKGIEVHYTGWQPGNVMEYADVNGNIVWSGCFPQWEH